MSVLIYNHRCRKPEWQYFDNIENKLRKELEEYRDVMIQEITFPKGTTRDYFAVSVCKEHYEMIHGAFEDMIKSKWGANGVCKLPAWQK